MQLKTKIIKYRLIEAHMKAVRAGRYEEGRYLLRLLRNHKLNVGTDDNAGFAAEITAEDCGCKVRYARNYNIAHITW